MLKTFAADRDGATSIEYAIIGAMLSIVIVACLAVMGPALDGAFERTVALFPN